MFQLIWILALKKLMLKATLMFKAAMNRTHHMHKPAVGYSQSLNIILTLSLAVCHVIALQDVELHSAQTLNLFHLFHYTTIGLLE